MGGSGGGASGTITWPAYIQSVHGQWLDNGGSAVANIDIVTIMNTAYNSNPFTGAVAHTPDGYITAMTTVLSSLASFFNNVSYISNYQAAKIVADTLYPLNVPTLQQPTLDAAATETTTLDIATLQQPTLDTTTLDASVLDTLIVTDESINAAMSALSAQLIEDFELITLPRYQAGMLDIGAVNTSSFKIGEAIMRAMVGRDVAKFGADLRVQLETQARQINAQHQLAFRQLNAQHQLSFREIESRQRISFQELNMQGKLAFEEITSRYKLSFRQIASDLTKHMRTIESNQRISFQELNLRGKLAFEELRARYITHTNDIRRGAVADMLAFHAQHMDGLHRFTHLNIDTYRIQATLKREEVEEQLTINESEAKWPLELFRYGANLIAAASGGVTQGNDKKSRAVSALSGALSGAATGAAIGSTIPGYGTAIGAAAGAIVGGVGGGLL